MTREEAIRHISALYGIGDTPSVLYVIDELRFDALTDEALELLADLQMAKHGNG